MPLWRACPILHTKLVDNIHFFTMSQLNIKGYIIDGTWKGISRDSNIQNGVPLNPLISGYQSQYPHYVFFWWNFPKISRWAALQVAGNVSWSPSDAAQAGWLLKHWFLHIFTMKKMGQVPSFRVPRVPSSNEMPLGHWFFSISPSKWIPDPAAYLLLIGCALWP